MVKGEPGPNPHAGRQSLELLNESGHCMGSVGLVRTRLQIHSQSPVLKPVPLVNRYPSPLCYRPVLQVQTQSLPSPPPG